MQEEKWPGPKGMIPVTSGNPKDANVHNRAYLNNLLVEMRLIGTTEVNLETEIFGEKFSTPIMTPAFSHLDKVLEDGSTPMTEYARAAKKMNMLNWVGMEPDEVFENITATGARSIRIIKPFADHEEITRQIKFAEEKGAIAVGIDIDHVPGTNGKYDVVDGIVMGPITVEDIKGFIASTKLPFILKGILSVQDALLAKEAGCAGIVVSHHHGRIPYGVPPLAILPEIKAALKDSDMKVFVDCSMDDGYDCYKALALGADAVSVGRGILKPLLDEGCEGVVKKVTRMNEELSELMMYTNVPDTKHFDPSVIRQL